MGQMLRRTVRVQPGGLIEIRAPELPEGATAEVTVEVGTGISEADRVRLKAELRELLRRSYNPDISEEDIADAIAAVRRGE